MSDLFPETDLSILINPTPRNPESLDVSTESVALFPLQSCARQFNLFSSKLSRRWNSHLADISVRSSSADSLRSIISRSSRSSAPRMHNCGSSDVPDVCRYNLSAVSSCRIGDTRAIRAASGTCVRCVRKHPGPRALRDRARAPSGMALWGL